MNKGKELLGNLKFYESYSKYDETLGRKETWEESAMDVMRMHYNKFKHLPELTPYIEAAELSYIGKQILASQRNLQFREDSINKHNVKIFNCSSTYIDRPEVFKEIMYILLNGCGAGYSVERRFIEQLPSIQKRKDETITHIIEDSVEGWSLAVDALIMSFFNGTEQIRFDGSLIRPEGAFISGGFKAPGYQPLKNSLEFIEKLLINRVSIGQQKLTSLDCHDIICHIADAVLSGGIRRSALICLFDKDDELMLKCKTGDWFYDNPQRGRANNSIKLLKSDLTKEEFESYKESIKEFGEPGIVLVDDIDYCTNPCVTKDTMVTTDKGTFTVESLIGQPFNAIVDGVAYPTLSAGFWSTGIKPVYKLTTVEGYELKLTDNHKLLTDGGWKELKDITLDDRIHIHKHDNYSWGDCNALDKDKGWLLGNLIGDGTSNQSDNTAILKYWGDEIYLGEYVKEVLNANFRHDKPFSADVHNGMFAIESVGLYNLANEYNILPIEKTPSSLIEAQSSSFYAGFIGGLFDADGSVQGNLNKGVSIRLSQVNIDMLKIIQRMLLKLGIRSVIYKDRRAEGMYDLPDGKGGHKSYLCKTTNELVISRESLLTFRDRVGFKCVAKQSLLNTLLSKYTRNLYKDRLYCSIESVQYIGDEEVYDVTVDKVHSFDANGIVAHNCCEIGFIPRNKRTGKSCISFCNLNEINGALCTTAAKFYDACKSAAILGTLQASYTNIPFLGQDTKELIEAEALIGVSITGIMDNPKILLNPEILRRGAEIVNETNELIAKIIGINPAARTTCVKPSGNASVLLGTSSGIHPAHSRRYFRIMQMNKGTEVAKVLAETNPILLENSVWSASGNDYAVYIPIEENDGALFKDALSDLEFVNAVEIVYKNWILPGTHRDRGYSDRVTHNVSNTITVQDWDVLFNHIFENKENFCGLSFMPSMGDKVYKQSPFTKVLSFEEIVECYGVGSVFASGLIVDSLHAFDGDLWDACEAVSNRQFGLVGDRYKVLLKKDVVRRIKKFAKNHFKNDIHKTLTCLKDIHLFHKWMAVSREYKKIDFTTIDFKPSFVDVASLGAVACSGGACEITSI